MKVLTKLMVAACVAPAFVAVSAQPAQAADCAVLVSTYTSGMSKYAKIRNNCGRRISAQAVINNWPDTGCTTISAYGTETIRTGGIASPSASYAREC